MSVTFVALVSLREILEALAEGTLAWQDFEKVRNFLQNYSGFDALHPAERSLLIPFLEPAFEEIQTWMKRRTNEERFQYFYSVMEGRDSFRCQLAYDPGEVANLANAPVWFRQLQDLGKSLLVPGANLREQRGKVGAFFRRIPVDTALGFAAVSFLRALMLPPPDYEKAKFWWGYLSGEKPVRLALTIRGLYVSLDFHE